jgi:hypothetical protein
MSRNCTKDMLWKVHRNFKYNWYNLNDSWQIRKYPLNVHPLTSNHWKQNYHEVSEGNEIPKLHHRNYHTSNRVLHRVYIFVISKISNINLTTRRSIYLLKGLNNFHFLSIKREIKIFINIKIGKTTWFLFLWV